MRTIANKGLGRDISRLLLPVVVLLLFVGLAVGTWLGVLAEGWWEISENVWHGPSSDHWLGTNALGQDILSRAVASTATAFEVGLTVTILSVSFGVVVGLIGGAFALRWPDHCTSWLTNVFDAMPFYLLAGALAVSLRGEPYGMQLAMVCAFWTTTARVIRAEVIQLASQTYVQSAIALGATPARLLLRHVLPNSLHVVSAQAAITLVVAIKAEVVLSFLGLGSLQRVSWGTMLEQAGADISVGHLGNLIGATGFLALFVWSLSRLADAMVEMGDQRWRDRADV